VLGSWGFRRLDVMVDRRVLIPRPETETVVEVALDCARRAGAGRAATVVADLGTGSGVIALSLAAELPIEGTNVWATDVSADALDVARANLAGLGRPAVNVRLAEGSWYEALPDELRGQLDLVVSNPPYVADNDPLLEPDVREWEPAAALFAGTDGLDAVRAVAEGATTWLRPGGWLVVEIGADHGEAARALATGAGLDAVEVKQDLAGRDRVLVARCPAR
jgi:release factor glutamine methyltransferase